MKKEVYFDNSATTRTRSEVIKVMVDVMDRYYGNPSSLHKKGIEAEKMVREARNRLAIALHCKEDEIVFTSGGTESNNLAIKGAAYSFRRRGNHIITTAIEHPSVLNTVKQLEEQGFHTDYLKVDKNGVIDLEELRNKINAQTVLVSIMMVNNEIGSIQPIKDAVMIVKKLNPGIIFHVDAVQAFGKLYMNLDELDIDLLSISAHKISGPKGIGALFIRRGVKIKPLFGGGEQEKGLRSGTENTPGIIGMGKAVEILEKDREKASEHMNKLKVALYNGIKANLPESILNGPEPGSEYSAPHILNVSFDGIKGEVLVHSLAEYGIYVSTGSACSSRHSSSSHVLKALGVKGTKLDGAIRFSFSPYNTMEEVDYTLEKITKIVKELRTLLRR